MKNKSFLIVRDKPVTRNSFSVKTRQRFDEIVAAGGEVFFLVDNSSRPEDGFVFNWKNPTQVAYRSYDDWLAAKQTENKEVEYG